MARTTVNVTGDAMVSVLIARGENELNTDIYNGDTTSNDISAESSETVNLNKAYNS